MLSPLRGWKKTQRVAGVETLVNTRVDPGVDPIREANRRGTILAIVKLGTRVKEKRDASGNEKQIAPKSSKTKENERGRQRVKLNRRIQLEVLISSVKIQELQQVIERD